MSAFLQNTDIAELYGTIIAGNNSVNPGEEDIHLTHLHEAQHQWNSLFASFDSVEKTPTLASIIEDAVEKSETDDVNELLLMVAKDFIRLRIQRVHIDARAHDEIIAYYKTGEPLDRIAERLKEHSVYDYVALADDALGDAKKEIEQAISGELTEVFKKIAIDEMVAATKNEYHRRLDQWLDAIRALEAKNYTRDDIIALLYQEPAHAWPALARRMPRRASQ
jgi:hypothetical protein